MIYFLTFLVTTLLIHLVVSRSMLNSFVRLICGALAVVIVAAVAGARDYGVGGPDVLVYGNKLFESAIKSQTIFALVDHTKAVHIDGDLGYVVLNFIVSRFTDDPHVFYFWLSLLVSGLVLLAILQMRRYGAASLMWLTYLCTAYVDTFNLLRQAPALAFALLGIAVTLRKRPILGLLIGSIGLLFHLSGAVFFVMWGIAIYLRGNVMPNKSWRFVVVLVLSAAVLALGTVGIHSFELLFPDSKYVNYLTQGARPGSPVGLDSLYRLVPILVGLTILGVFRRRHSDTGDVVTHSSYVHLRTKEAPVLLVQAASATLLTPLVTFLIIELLLLPLREIAYPLYRIPMYFGFIRIIAYGVTVEMLSGRRRIVAQAGLILFVVAYFVLITLMRNDGSYSSAIFSSWH